MSPSGSSPDLDADPAQPAPYVVLLHGIWMRGFSLTLLRRRLESAGYRTLMIEYASVMRGPQLSVERVVEKVRGLGGAQVHFVGHSLGGLIALQALRAAPNLPPGRVVCLGSPLRGSSAARGLTRMAGGSWLMGKSADLLHEGLQAWDGARPVGVIAGRTPRGLGRLLGSLAAPNDGTVSVEETQLPGIADHLVLASTHSGLVFSGEVAQQTVNFLRDGRFAHGVSPSG